MNLETAQDAGPTAEMLDQAAAYDETVQALADFDDADEMRRAQLARDEPLPVVDQDVPILRGLVGARAAPVPPIGNRAARRAFFQGQGPPPRNRRDRRAANNQRPYDPLHAGPVFHDELPGPLRPPPAPPRLARTDTPPPIGYVGVPAAPRADVPLRRALPAHDVPYDFHDDEATLMRRHYRIEPNRVSVQPHTHGFLALGRALTERAAISMIQRSDPNARILDVGGSPARHAACRRNNVWSACPTLSPRDAGRALAYPRTPSGDPVGWCNERAEDCSHGPFDIALSVHSLYYLGPEQIYRILLKTRLRRMFAVVHSFPEISGQTLCGQAHYYRPDPDNVVFAVNQEQPYHHAHIDWVERGFLYVPGTDVMVIAKRADIYGDHHIYRIELASAVPEVPPPANYRIALACREESTAKMALPPMTYPTEKGVVPVEFHGVALDNIMFFRGVAFVYGASQKFVPISRHILANVTSDASYKNRDPTLLRELTNRARKQYAERCYHMPEELRTEAVLITAMLAMSKTVEQETRTISNAKRRWGSTWSLLSSQLSTFDGPLDLTRPVTLALSFVLGAALVVLYHRVRRAAVVVLGRRVLALLRQRQGLPTPPALVTRTGTFALTQLHQLAIASPFYEEPFKRVVAAVLVRAGCGSVTACALSGLAFGCFEVYERTVCMSTAHGFMQVPTMVSHVAWTVCPLPVGIICHAAHNWYLVACWYFQQEVAFICETPGNYVKVLDGSKSFPHVPIPAPVQTAVATLYANASNLARISLGILVATRGVAACRVLLALWFDRLPAQTGENVHYPPVEFVVPGETIQAPPKFARTRDPHEGVQQVFEVASDGRLPRLQLVSIAFASCFPSYYIGTAVTERSAIEQRLLIDRPDEDLDAWAQAHALYDASPACRALEADGPIQYRGRARFEEWLLKYPSERRRSTLRAAAIATNGRALTAHENRRSLFVKGEVRMEYFCLDGFFSTKPGTCRSIISSTLERLSRTAPFFYYLGLRMQAVWTGNFPVLFGACSCETLGTWFAYWYRTFGPECWFLMTDTVRQDAHYGKAAINGEIRRWMRRGLTGRALAGVLQGRCFSALSRSGLRVAVRYRRASGDPSTTVGNTEENLEVATYAMDYPGSLVRIGVGSAAAIAGDDNSSLCAARPDTDQIAARALSLGFPLEITCSHNLWDFEFCSKLMYPSADGFTPAPKLGRMITKFGWKIITPQADHRSVASAVLDDMWHVPFAREYLQTILRVLPVSKRRTVVLDDYKMHVSRRHDQSPDVWPFLESRYGLTRADHDEFVAMLASISAFPVIIDVPWALRVLQRDS